MIFIFEKLAKGKQFLIDEHLLITSLAGFLGILVIISPFPKWAWARLKHIFRLLTRFKPKVPSETVKIQSIPGGSYWTKVEGGDEPFVRFIAQIYVTNIYTKRVHLLAAKLLPEKIESDVGRMDNLHVWSPSIDPEKTTEMMAQFTFSGKKLRKADRQERTIVFMDQFKNEYEIKKLVFEANHSQEGKTKPTEKTKEKLFDIKSGLEKDIVSILKEEISSYNKRGRGVGELGSIYVPRDDGRPGAEFSLLQGSNEKVKEFSRSQTLSSEHLSTLLKRFELIEANSERKEFSDALLKRISRNIEYCKIGYFIALTLYRIGFLEETLEKAEKDLKNDDENGFSNFLFLLNALIRYEGLSFDSDSLDLIERYATNNDPKEHHHLQQKVHEARAAKVRNESVRQKGGGGSGPGG